MDWETPADGWYVWLGVSVVSLAMAGFVLGLPTGPPPDAARAANAIERTAGSTYQAASTVEHDADEIRVDGKTIELRNEHGTDRSSIRYGEVVAVNGKDRLEDLVRGEALESVYEDELDDPEGDVTTAFVDDVANAEEDNAGAWLAASDALTVRQVSVEPDDLIRLRASVATDRADRTDRMIDLPETVTVDYEGFDDRTAVSYTVEGESVVSDLDGRNPHVAVDTDHGRSGTTHYRSGTEELRLRSNIERGYWGGDFPLTVTASFDGHTCRGELEGPAASVDLCTVTTATDERADRLDAIELNDETGDYHVTLVVV